MFFALHKLDREANQKTNFFTLRRKELAIQFFFHLNCSSGSLSCITITVYVK